MFIFQDLFDETLAESQEVFEYESHEQAVQETISELLSQNKDSRLDHLSLTHPDSEQGKKDREQQREFVAALEAEDLSLAMAILVNANASSSPEGGGDKVTMLASLVLQHGFCQLRSKLMKRLEEPEEGDSSHSSEDHELEIDEMIQFLLSVLSDSRPASGPSGGASPPHLLLRELKLQLGRTLLQERWFPLFDRYPLLRVPLINLARLCCNGCEANKKTLVQAGIRYQACIPEEGVQIPTDEIVDDDSPTPATTSSGSKRVTGIGLWMECLPQNLKSNANELMAKELCKLLTILGKFQASAESGTSDSHQAAPIVSSAHANVKEFFKCDAVSKLHVLARECLEIHPTMSDRKRGEREILLCHVLSALRVMAIDNEIVQQMVVVGILDTLNTSGGGTTTTASTMDGDNEDRTLLIHQPNTAGATLGLLRNLCANDEIKSTLCRQSLSSILQAMELHSMNPSVQEHGCGILAAMSLRNPQNVTMICQATRGGEPIVKAMKAFPLKVPLQRQGCLAIRNMASRATVEGKQMLLDAGVEFVLREIAGRHQESIDEAYAALRDLDCPTVRYTIDQETGKMRGTQLFGEVQSNFRPVYE